MDFDKPRFESLMHTAVLLHQNGQYSDALKQNLEAYNIAPTDSTESGRAARDISSQYHRLNRTTEADQWANIAYDIHTDLILNCTQTVTQEALRERSVSAMNLGVMGLSKVIKARLAGTRQPDTSLPLLRMRQSWLDIQSSKAKTSAKIDRFVDQYEINVSRRVSVAESLIGNKKNGLRIGSKAVALALLSESPRMATSNTDLSFRERSKTKTKALLGGLATLSVNLLSRSQNSNLQYLAYKIADQII